MDIRGMAGKHPERLRHIIIKDVLSEDFDAARCNYLKAQKNFVNTMLHMVV